MPLLDTTGNNTEDAYQGGIAVIPNYIEDMFSTYLYTGTGASQTITNNIDLSTKGGLVWLKNRSSGGYNHCLFDTNRGATNQLNSDGIGGNNVQINSLTAFNTTGFDIGSSNNVNQSSQNYVSWTFRKQTKFFDIVTYTGTGSNTTIAHNLGSVPGCIIVKRTDGGGGNWAVYHRGTSAGNKYIFLNRTDAEDSGFYWNPTSTTFDISYVLGLTANGGTYVAYIFAHNAGGFGLTGTDNVISCGSYVGTGATGNSVTLGYEPQWLMVKDTTAANDWIIYDNMRGMPASATNTGNTKFLKPNLSNAEAGGNTIAPTATGFEINTSASVVNTTGDTYIYVAIRRGPMKVPTDATKVFSPVTYTGNNTARSISLTARPDIYIPKSTTDYTPPTFFDRLRGVTEMLFTSSTNAGYVDTTALTALNNSSVTLGDDTTSGYNNTNQAGYDYIAYGMTRAPSFFDEVCYSGNGTGNRALTHNLGVAPEMMILKCRNTAGTNWQWWVYHKDIPNTPYATNMTLNSNEAAYTWGSTINTPTATTFTVGSSFGNGSGYTFVSYLFATCTNVSKVGSYTGNGTTQAIACGFTGGARFVLIKRTDSTGDWYVYDTTRGMTTLTDPYFFMNSTNPQTATLGSVTTTTGGFTVNASILSAINTSSATYIFLAIA